MNNYNVSDQDFVIVSGGKFDEYKNIIPLVDSYEKLKKEKHNVVLVFFGTLDKKYYDYIQNKKIIYLF